MIMFTKNITLRLCAITGIFTSSLLTPLTAMKSQLNVVGQNNNNNATVTASSSSSSSSTQPIEPSFETIFHIDANVPNSSVSTASINRMENVVKYKSYQECKKLFSQFIESDNFNLIFKHVIFKKNERKKLFENNTKMYNEWLTASLQNFEIAQTQRNSHIRISSFITMQQLLAELAKTPNLILDDKSSYANYLAERLAIDIFVDGNDSQWRQPKTFSCGDNVCINGFIEILRSLLKSNFAADPNFARNCRIFITIYCILLVDFVIDCQPGLFSGLTKVFHHR